MTIVRACILVLLTAVLVSAVLGALGAPVLVRLACLVLIAFGAAVAVRRTSERREAASQQPSRPRQ
jgi:hypothetical protein